MKGLTTKLISCAAGCLVLVLFVLATASAQADSPISITLSGQNSYLPGEPIDMRVTVSNDSGSDVYTREGFMSRRYYLMINITDPDGNPVSSMFQQLGHHSGMPIRFDGHDAAIGEIILSTWESIAVFNVLNYYDLDPTNYGLYTAQVWASLETFPATYTDPESGALLVYLDDATSPGPQNFSPLASNNRSFMIAPLGGIVQTSIHVEVDHLKIGGGSNPGATKTPLENVKVRLFRRASLTDYEPVNWKTYSAIWGSVDPVMTGTTDSFGVAKFETVTQDDYFVISFHNETQDFKHMGSPIDGSDPDWGTGVIIEKHLKLMEKSDGKKVPGKTTKLKGSELLITEPEYVEWNSTTELYPFVFEGIGDWDVSTLVNPPEGFVSNYDSLSSEVINEMESVQFTVTEVGSRWEDTKVTYKIKHKGKNKIIRSKIGIKLSKKFAEKKGLGRYGHTESPGPFKGGKKVGKKVAHQN